MDKLLEEASKLNVHVFEKQMSSKIKGLYGDGVIWLNKNILSTTEKACVLAEELGHHHTSVGNILDLNSHLNRKQERRARQWAHVKLIPLQRIVDAHNARVKGRHELAEFLGVTERFLQEAIDRYKEVHGLYAFFEDHYIVTFDPLRVIELIDNSRRRR